MALDNQFGKGIGVAAGFDLGAQKPLDARVAVNTIAERDAHVENNRAYEGMLVYVAEAGMTYQLVKGEEEGQLVWKEFGFNQNDFDGSFNDAIKDVDDRLDAIEADLAQGGETETRIAQAEADIDGLQGLVGQPAQAGEGEEEGVPATGLHLALDNVKAELEQDVLDEKGRAEGQEAAIRQELADEAAEIRGEMEEAHKAMDQAMEEAHEAINQAMAGMKAELQGEIDADVKVEKERAEGVEAAIRQELANEKAALQKEIDDDIKVEKERAEAKELELANAIAKEIEDREGAIEDLAKRHDEEMEAAEGRLDALEALHKGENSVENQIANAKQEVLDAVGDEKDRAEEQERLIRQELADAIGQYPVEADPENGVEAVEGSGLKGEMAAVVDQLQNAMGQLEEDLVGQDDEIKARLDALVGQDVGMEGNEELGGIIKDAMDDMATAIGQKHDGEIAAHEARIKANEDKLAGLEEGCDTVQAAIDKAEADAKAHAEQKIADLIDSAPDAMNTLNELAKAINDNKGVYDAYVEQHTQAMADLKEELQGEIDADVKVVADELAKQKDAEQEGTLANQIKVEKARAEGQEAAIRQELANEKDALQKEIDADIAAESALRVAEEQRIEGKVDAEAQRAVAEEKRIVGLVEAEKGRAEGKEGELLAAINKEVEDRGNAVKAEKERAEGQEAAIRGEMAAAIGQHAAEGVEASGLRKEIDDAVAVEKTRAEGQEAAIRGEFAAADTALHNQIRGEMAQVIQSLSASITEDGMLRIALGGNDDVLVIKEQMIPVMNDNDIAELLAGLDEEE